MFDNFDFIKISMAITFFSIDKPLQLTDRKKLKHFIVELFNRHEMPLFSVSYVFCNDEYLLAINKKFLGHVDYTDVITFCLSNKSEPIVGEIYISTQRVKENAFLIGVSKKEELHRVIFHGALHLCGFNDKSPVDKRNMTLAEDELLSLYFAKN